MVTVKEQVISFCQYRQTVDDSEIHFFVTGFEPSYNPITCIKGEPKTMTELVKGMENMLGVKITLEKGG